MLRHCRHTLNLLDIFRTLTVISSILFISSIVYADVCVWRNPERTMTKIFPEAGDYKTITRIISAEKKEIIEKKLQDVLMPGESKDWIYYEITSSSGKTLGYILADAEKGEYGVIEIIMGITPDGRVKGLYIQRAREKDKEFKSDEFLQQFIGKTITDPIQIGNYIKATNDSIAVKAIILSVRKMLIFYDELGKEK